MASVVMVVFVALLFTMSMNGSPYIPFTISVTQCLFLTKFKNALELLDKHLAKSYHTMAIVKLEEFTKVMLGRQQSVRIWLNESAIELVASNHRKLQSIVGTMVETIVFCGRQNIPLHGHRDSGLDIESSTPATHGDF